MNIYIYIYIYTHTYIHVNSRSYLDFCRGPHLSRGGRCAANLRTKIRDFRGFDSSIILKLRGGILRSIGDLTEVSSQRILVGIILVGRLGVTQGAPFFGAAVTHGMGYGMGYGMAWHGIWHGMAWHGTARGDLTIVHEHPRL